jgi:hypothetical protein
MKPECLQRLCESIASHPLFLAQAEALLAHLVERIKSEQMRSVLDANADPKTVELQGQFLVNVGVAAGHAFFQDSKSLRMVIGELVNLNIG